MPNGFVTSPPAGTVVRTMPARPRYGASVAAAPRAAAPRMKLRRLVDTRSILSLFMSLFTFLVGWLMDGESKRMAPQRSVPWCCTRMMRTGSVTPSGESCRGSGLRGRGCVRHLLGCSPRCRRAGSPRLDKTLRHDREQLGDGRRGDRGHGADADAVADGHRGVAVQGEVVDDDIGYLRQPLPARMLRSDGVGVLEAGDGDDGVAALLGAQRHLDDRAVDPELEAMMKTSAGCRESPSSSSATTEASRSNAAPESAVGSRFRPARRRGERCDWSGSGRRPGRRSPWRTPRNGRSRTCTTPPALNASTISLQAESRALALAPSASRSRRLTTSPR